MLPVLYFIKSAITLSLLWGFYRLLLRPTTFFGANRRFLLACMFLSVLLPFIDLSALVNSPAAGWRSLAGLPAVEFGYVSKTTPLPAGESRDTGSMLTLFYCLVSGILLFRLLLQWASLYQLHRRAQCVTEGGQRIGYISDAGAAFSFGRTIYLNPMGRTAADREAILRHESVHVREWHSFDVLIAELFCACFWLNPFAWLLRRDLRENLEFLADRGALQSGLEPRSYQYLLVRLSDVQVRALTTPISFSSLKKRIIMMNQKPTALRKRLRFFVALPLLAGVLLVFRSQAGDLVAATYAVKNGTEAARAKGDTAGVPNDYRWFLARNAKVLTDINWTSQPTLTAILHFRNGKKEYVALNDPKAVADAERRFGKLPAAPPPPPRPWPRTTQEYRALFSATRNEGC